MIEELPTRLSVGSFMEPPEVFPSCCLGASLHDRLRNSVRGNPAKFCMFCTEDNHRDSSHARSLTTVQDWLV